MRPRLSSRLSSALWAGSLTVAIVLASLLPAESQQSVEDGQSGLPFAAEFAEAETTGEPVEIESKRSSTDTLYANPSGTLTRETSSTPIRVRTDDGWEAVDLTLVKDGSTYRPTMASGEVLLSGGGTGPLLTTTTDGVTSSISWRGDLPTPSIDGPTATYPDVLPDVDLRMTVSEVGVSQVLVVHSAEAASDPKLREVSMGAHVEGGSLVSEAGGYQVQDEGGQVVAIAPAPVMWDSSGTIMDVNREQVPDASTEAIDQRTTGPAHGDEINPVDLELTDDSLVLRPDRAALDGPDVEYPVYIDPVSMQETPQAWGMLFKQHPDSSFYKWTDEAGQGVGHQNYNGVSTKRLTFQYGTKAVAGQQIINATFTARLRWSASCATRSVNVYRISSVSSGHTWNNQPTWGPLQDTKAISAGWADCYPNGRDVAWDVKSGVQEIADAGRTTIALGMRVSDETDPLTWRRFRHTATLRIEYNRRPYTASSVMIAGKLCVADPVTLLGAQTSAPAMSAVVKDPDGNNVRARFQFDGGYYIDQSTNDRLAPSGVKSGTRSALTMPVSPSNGTMPDGTWSFRVRANDSHGALGRYSAKCTFKIDSTPGWTPRIVDNNPEARWTSGRSSVVIHPAEDKAADTARYAVTVDDDQPPTNKRYTPTAADKSITVALPESGKPDLLPGKHVIRAWAYDAAGNVSPVASHVISVESAAPGTRSIYRFEGEGDAAGADTGGDFPAVLGGAERTRRAVERDGDTVLAEDRMLYLRPTTSPLPFIEGEVVDPSRAFSVAALLDPRDREPRSAMTALSIEGSTGTKLAELGVEPVADGYDYVFRVWDTQSAGWITARLAGEDGYAGTSLVVAMFDPVAKQISLQLPEQSGDGVEVQFSGQTPQSLNEQRTVLGSDAAGTSRWLGGIDDLVLGRGVFSESEIEDMVTNKKVECFDSEKGCE